MTTPDIEQDDPPNSARVKLWDLPVRITHWSFVLLLPLLWWSQKSDRMDLHQLLGYVTLALLLFRLFWGFAGSSTARFRDFVRGPRAVLAYLRSLRAADGAPIVGHNPLGGWSAIVLLGLLALQIALGLIAVDEDGIVTGPLADYVSFATSEAARDWHEQVFNVLLGFVGLHVAAIFAYLVFRRDNLIGPMLSGRKRLPVSATAVSFAPAWRAAVGVIICAGIAWWIAEGAPI